MTANSSAAMTSTTSSIVPSATGAATSVSSCGSSIVEDDEDDDASAAWAAHQEFWQQPLLWEPEYVGLPDGEIVFEYLSDEAGHHDVGAWEEFLLFDEEEEDDDDDNDDDENDDKETKEGKRMPLDVVEASNPSNSTPSALPPTKEPQQDMMVRPPLHVFAVGDNENTHGNSATTTNNNNNENNNKNNNQPIIKRNRPGSVNNVTFSSTS